MNIIWLCIPAALFVTPAFSAQMIDTSRIRVFPAVNQSIAGLVLVTSLNKFNQPQYAFNASEARKLCSSLGLNIASRAQVDTALSRGMETCRFGWVDEHLVVIPRIQPLANCGQNKRGLVIWRVDVTQKFDVFCFNESDAAIQQRLYEVTDSPLMSTHDLGHTHHTTTQSTAFSSIPETFDNDAEPARFVSSLQGFTGVKAVLIICACALILLVIIILAYLKLRRSQKSDVKQQQEHIQTEEWTCVKTITENEQAVQEVQEDERIEVGDTQ